MAYENGYYTAARRNYHVALETAQKLGLPDELLCENLLGLAKTHFEQGDFSEAERLYKRVLAIDESICEQDDYSLANDLTDLAKLYIKTGNTGAAEPLLSRSLAILGNLAPKRQLDLAQVLKYMGMVCCEDNRLLEAQRYLTKALAIADTFKHDRKLFAEILASMAIIAVKQGRLKDAEDCVQQAISVCEVATGGRHPEVADFLELAADILKVDGLQIEAQIMRERADAIRGYLRQNDH
jgi:tetratricopeptide (TPR) repeat protein